MIGEGRGFDDLVLRDAVVADFEAMLRLNLESEHFLSPLDSAQLAALYGEAAHRRVVVGAGQVLGFLLAFRAGANYTSPNYQWFCARFANFLYIDRIVIDAMARGRGLGLLFYRDLFASARAQGIARVTCEYDIEPPNEGSRRFHARLGFREIGTQRVADGKKAVSLQEVLL